MFLIMFSARYIIPTPLCSHSGYGFYGQYMLFIMNMGDSTYGKPIPVGIIIIDIDDIIVNQQSSKKGVIITR